jgi:hypothetical protein
MRTLIVIPVVHAERDMGSLFGDQFRSADQVWSGIRSMIAELALPYTDVRLYQDALPLCEKETDLVREIAAGGSKNHQFLVELMEQGARLVGTEDPHLLLQEYQLLQGVLGGGKQGPESRREDQRQRLRSNRDRFIAGRINATLSAGEIGLLFLGAAHSVEQFLDADILVRRLLPSLRDRQGKVEPAAA